MASGSSPTFRIGHGYDLHRLEPLPPNGNGRPLVLGGVAIEHDKGAVGHSDGDAMFHAVTDAILGALGQPDIGQAFPDHDPQYDGADSRQFLEHAQQTMARLGYTLGNIDITVICERPKISPHKAAIIASIAQVLECDIDRVNLKGKTHEGVDAIGEGRAIEVHVAALLVRG